MSHVSPPFLIKNINLTKRNIMKEYFDKYPVSQEDKDELIEFSKDITTLKKEMSEAISDLKEKKMTKSEINAGIIACKLLKIACVVCLGAANIIEHILKEKTPIKEEIRSKKLGNKK